MPSQCAKLSRTWRSIAFAMRSRSARGSAPPSEAIAPDGAEGRQAPMARLSSKRRERTRIAIRWNGRLNGLHSSRHRDAPAQTQRVAAPVSERAPRRVQQRADRGRSLARRAPVRQCPGTNRNPPRFSTNAASPLLVRVRIHFQEPNGRRILAEDVDADRDAMTSLATFVVAVYAIG